MGEKIMLRWMLWKQVMNTTGERNGLRIMLGGGL